VLAIRATGTAVGVNNALAQQEPWRCQTQAEEKSGVLPIKGTKGPITRDIGWRPVGSAGEVIPKNYDDARSTFRASTALVKRVHPNAETGQIEVPSKTDNDLTIDWLYVPPTVECKNLVIISSGIHGPEGFVGSAAQQVFLRETFPTLDLKETGVLLVHGINPWGYRHHRRVTENNVDLNRNFLLDESQFAAKPNPGYEKIQRYGRVKRPVRGVFGAVWRMIMATVVSLLSLGSKNAAGTAIGGGQYRDPKALFFGGNKYEPQSQAVGELIRKRTADFDNVLLLDVHTGVGEKNKLHMMTGMNRQSSNAADRPSRAAMEELLNDGEVAGKHIWNEPTDDDAYRTYGDFIDYVAQMVPKTSRVIPITMEFGTRGDSMGQLLYAGTLAQLENRGFHEGYGKGRRGRKLQREVPEKYMQMFLPKDPAWRESMLGHCRYVFEDVVKNRFCGLVAG